MMIVAPGVLCLFLLLSPLLIAVSRSVPWRSQYLCPLVAGAALTKVPTDGGHSWVSSLG
jgi:hypothetical protein